jgi:RNA polymerase sigma-70 factor (ECF subfamily)
VETADIVQDVFMQTFRRIDRFEDRGRGALRAYLRQAVVNRINDEVRRVLRRPVTELDDQVFELAGNEPSPFDTALDAERDRQYKQGLSSLSEDERLLIVGRLELGYNYHQLALLTGRVTPDAARLAVRRAMLKLTERMSSG